MPLNAGNSAFQDVPVVHDNFTSLGPGSIPVTDARELPFAPDSLPANDASEESNARNRANTKLAALSRKYWNSIPIDEIDRVLTGAGLKATEGGIYTGREGRSHEKVGPNTYLALQWHKMEHTGRWEINAYVS